MKLFDRLNSEKIQLLFQGLFIASLFLLHIPYYYLLPIHISIVNSYALARVTTLIMFCLAAMHPAFQKYNKVQHDAIFLLLLLTFFGQSLSIFGSSDVNLYFGLFEDWLFTLLFYYCCVIFIQLSSPQIKKVLLYIFIAAISISIADELFVFLFPSLYLAFARAFLHPSQLEFISVNLFRSRLYVNRYNEGLIPILIYLIVVVQKRYKKITLSVSIILIFIIALLSGWRIRLVAALCAFVGTIIVFFPLHKKINFKNKIVISLLVFCIVTTGIVTSQLMHYYLGYSTFGRLTFESTEDIQALTSRLDFFDKSLYLFRSSPIFGVGLGHYPIVGDKPYRQFRSIFKEQELQAEEVALSPHNIFFQSLAETGLVGTIPLLFLFIYCFCTDIRTFFRSKVTIRLQKICIVCFWSLFLFSQFHSPMGFHYYALLFGIRAIISNPK